MLKLLGRCIVTYPRLKYMAKEADLQYIVDQIKNLILILIG